MVLLLLQRLLNYSSRFRVKTLILCYLDCSNLNHNYVSVLFRPSPPSPTLVAQIDSSVACLWLLTPLSAGTAVVAVLVAVSTNNWLHTQENMLNPSYNGTGRHDLVAKQTVSGLWRICHTDRKFLLFFCSYLCIYLDVIPFKENKRSLLRNYFKHNVCIMATMLCYYYSLFFY